MPAYRLKGGDKSVIRRKVAALHVSASVRDVLRPFVQHARRAFNGKVKDKRAADLWRERGTRRAVYREALRQHARNQELFYKVASGRF
jgi:hypothetical protein